MTSGAWADASPRKAAARPGTPVVAQAPAAEAPNAEAPGNETSRAGARGKESDPKGVRHARSERGEMTADRPELGVSSRTVGRGRVQLEMETEYEQETRDGETITRVVAPNALLRFGVTDDLELRVASNLLVFEGAESGLANATLGVKWNFSPGENSFGMLALAQGVLVLGRRAVLVQGRGRAVGGGAREGQQFVRGGRGVGGETGHGAFEGDGSGYTVGSGFSPRARITASATPMAYPALNVAMSHSACSLAVRPTSACDSSPVWRFWCLP